jgi:hypothetical protein
MAFQAAEAGFTKRVGFFDFKPAAESDNCEITFFIKLCFHESSSTTTFRQKSSLQREGDGLELRSTFVQKLNTIWR